MNQKQIQRWESTREKGMVRFLLIHGVLGWGLPMFVIMTFWMNKTSLEDTGKIISSIVIWGIGGLFFGFWMWKMSEKKYLKSSKID